MDASSIIAALVQGGMVVAKGMGVDERLTKAVSSLLSYASENFLDLPIKDLKQKPTDPEVQKSTTSVVMSSGAVDDAVMQTLSSRVLSEISRAMPEIARDYERNHQSPVTSTQTSSGQKGSQFGPQSGSGNYQIGSAKKINLRQTDHDSLKKN